MVHYAVVINGRVIGSRSSKSHAQQIYTHAVIEGPIQEITPYEELGVVSYHSSEQLAKQAREMWRRSNRMRALSVVPVSVTARRAKVGDLVVPQGVL